MDEKYKRKSREEKRDLAFWDLSYRMCEIINVEPSVVNSHPEWYMDHTWNQEQLEDFRSYGVEFLYRNKVFSHKKICRKAMDYFIFEYGWSVDKHIFTSEWD